jgi:hypothetical protein
MSGARLVKGRKYRLVRDMHEPDFPVGTVFTYVDSVDYFDWFKCLIEIDVGRLRTPGGTMRMTGWVRWPR